MTPIEISKRWDICISRRDFLKLSSTALGAAFLAGCAPKITATPEVTAAITGPLTLDYWSVAWAGAQEVADSFIQAYQTKGGQPDAKMNFSQFPADRLPERLMLAMLAGEGPHLFNQNDVEWTRYTYTKSADPLPLEAFEVDSYDDLAKYYRPGILDVVMKAAPDGKVYVVDETATVYGLVYNATAFDEAGIPRPSPTEPMTWEDWAEITSQLSVWDGDTLVRSGYAARMEAPFWKETFQNHFAMLVKQAGGKLISDDGKTALFNSEEAIRGFQIFVDLYKKYKTITPGFVTDTFGDFEAGRIVSLLTFPAFYATEKGKDLPFEVGAAPLPVLKGGKRITSASFAGFLVNPKRPEAERKEAWKFLAWFMKNPNDWGDIEVGKYGTAIAMDNKWHADKIKTDPNWNTFYGTQQYAEPALLSPRALEIKDVVMTAISDMITKEVPVAEALNKAKEAADAILAQPGV